MPPAGAEHAGSATGEQDFISAPSKVIRRRLSFMQEKEAWVGVALSPMYAGLSASLRGDSVEIGLSIHDGTYSTDYKVHRMPADKDETYQQTAIRNYIVEELIKFSKAHFFKFVGAGVTEELHKLSPMLCTDLWKGLDIVPFVVHVHSTHRFQAGGYFSLPNRIDTSSSTSGGNGNGARTPKPRDVTRGVDEQADSAVRKTVMHFGPHHIPRLTIGYRNQVEVDAGFRIHLIDDLAEFEKSVRPSTWKMVNKYAGELIDNEIKVAFFNSTPQGGGVALMRHALMRLYKLLGVNATWYVPKPNPQVFRTTKNNHNIIQGVADPNLRFTKPQQDQFTDWMNYNAERYWLSEGGPLAPGGADVVIIDDPQMPQLIPLIKKARPDLPIIYRSHIEVRSDLIEKEGSPQAEVWDYLWSRIQHADIFLAHPVKAFVPHTVPPAKVGLMPAATDWLDGLSKTIRDWDLRYYHHNFRNLCSETRMYKLMYPQRQYICQVARFDPSKGIPTVIDSYAKLRRKLDHVLPNAQTPQLLICGHGAIDDPDASLIYDETLKLLEKDEYAPYATDVIVMRIGPSDQMLNSLMSCARVVLQLSSREGFEVKVSEAIHKGKPIIATRAGGIPLQVKHGQNGYLVEVGDSTAVAKHLYDLWTDTKLYDKMSAFGKISVSDEVSTVGNAALFMYMAAKLGTGQKLEPNGKWVHDMMREDAGVPFTDEPHLPRTLGT